MIMLLYFRSMQHFQRKNKESGTNFETYDSNEGSKQNDIEEQGG